MQNRLVSSKIFPEKFPQNKPFFAARFLARFAWKFPQISHKIGCFICEFVYEKPTKFDFFFCNLSEALKRSENKLL